MGTVHIALAGPGAQGEDGDEIQTQHRKIRFPGDRERVRWFSSQFALDLLRRRLLARRAVPVPSPS